MVERALSVSSTAMPVDGGGRARLQPLRLEGEEGINGLFEYHLLLQGAGQPPRIGGGTDRGTDGGTPAGAAVARDPDLDLDLDLDGFLGREIARHFPDRWSNVLVQVNFVGLFDTNIKLFAHQHGMHLSSARGNIEIVALHKSVNLLAKLEITQTANHITLTAKEEIVLNGGGSDTVWNGGGITSGNDPCSGANRRPGQKQERTTR